jgi:predicted SAM-dependent methyltransferase
MCVEKAKRHTAGVSELVRSLADKATGFVGWLRRGRRIKLRADGCVKVNLGAGLDVAAGWLNIDGSLNALIAAAPAWLHPLAYRLSGARQFYAEEAYCEILRDNTFLHHNLIYGIPLPDQSVHFVYSSHLLEHLDRSTGRQLLEECWRILRPGGVARFGVPDLEVAWELYVHGDKERMLHDFFFVTGATGLSQHRYAYDFELLSRALLEAGFVDVHRVHFGEGAVPDLESLDNRQDYTLFVEARRPLLQEVLAR